MGIEYNSALISINATLVVQLISFLIFLFIINRLMFKPLNKVMDERESSLAKAEKDVIEATAELETMAAKLIAMENNARAKAARLRKELDDDGKEQAKDISVKIRDEIDASKKALSQKVEAQILEARKSMKEESEKLALPIMEKILGRELS